MSQPRQGELLRTLGLFSVFLLTVSSVIGSGIYKKVAPMSSELGSPSLVIVCWIAAGLITICGALSNAEVASLLAGSGGEYGYYRKIYNKFFAFLFGWSSFTAIRSASAASIAYVFGQSLNLIVPLPRFSPEIESLSLFGIFTPLDNFGVKTVTILLIVGLSYVNYKGLKLGEGLSRIVLLVVVVSIFLIIILGLTIGGGSLENFQTTATGYVSRSWTDGLLWQSIFAAMLSAFWAYEGWNAIGFLGGEIKNPNRNLPLALVFGVSFVMLVYVLINFTYLFVLPIDQLISVTNTTNAIAAVEVISHFLGGGGAMFISVLILFTTFGCTNTTLLPPPRLYYTMAKEGMFFKGAATIHPVYNTPSKAIMYQAIWATILVLSGSFDQLTDMLIFASFIFYGATTLGVFILRYRMPDAPRPYKAWGYPVLPALFIIFCAVLVVITLITRTKEAVIGLTLMMAGIPFYYYWDSKSKTKSDPNDN